MSKKSFANIDCLDYWMAMTFLLGAKSPNKNAAVITENSVMVATGVDTRTRVPSKSDVMIPAEAVAIVNCKFELTNASIFLTRTPDFNAAAIIMAKTGLRKVVYYPTRKLDERTSDLMQSFFGEMVEYDGNLNWVYDYFASLDL